MDDASVFDEFDDSDNFEPVPIVSRTVPFWIHSNAFPTIDASITPN
jgi:hypothetical protein